MIHYILQTLAFKLLFLATYDLFFKKETFFNWNRIYLLITPILSFILPFVHIDFIRQSIPNEYTIQLPTVLITDSPIQLYNLPEIIIESENHISSYVSLIHFFEYLWYIGIAISLMLFLYKVIKIYKLRQSGTKVNIKDVSLISLPNTDVAFSFFNTIYIGNNLSEVKKTNIILHEKVHVKELHSVDLLFFEILRILFWFNPLIYIYQKRIATLQEYIADSKAIIEISKKEYYQDLLSQIFQTNRISFVNKFFNHSLIKKRIIMLQKSKSKKIFQLKYLLLIPIITTMLIYSSCTEDASAQNSITDSSKSEVLNKIKNLKDAIARQGNMTNEEKKELKTLLMLTSENGLKEPFFQDVVDHAEIPFGVIEKVPVYPGCENMSQEETKKCFSQKISMHIGQNFNTKIGKKIGLIGRLKMIARFKINNTGKIIDIDVKGPHPELENEAKRVISQLPLIKPGVQDGVNVSVFYSLPIVFEIKE